jgi:hypothetical protein
MRFAGWSPVYPTSSRTDSMTASWVKRSGRRGRIGTVLRAAAPRAATRATTAFFDPPPSSSPLQHEGKGDERGGDCSDLWLNLLAQ